MTAGLTLGVIGHVDHGKTALVRALTGTETDRLEEERERGLSIVLGFAFLETPLGTVDLIDVPGHEDFIRAMIGGATALDGVVLCVAANEGVKPQTVEHFHIARLLGVTQGLVVITKADLVDRESRAAVEAQVRGLVHGTFLEHGRVIEASVLSGAGIDAVREAIAQAAAVSVKQRARGKFFLPLDRVFTMRGFGLVGTGTLRGGDLRVGEAVEVMPGGKISTVRALQNHRRAVDWAVPGQRVAVNLRHLSRDDVARGDVLAAPGSIAPARRFDAEISVLDGIGTGLKNGAAVRFLTGTTEAGARVRLLDRDELEPGDTGFAQLALDRDVATQPWEYYLLRSYSPMRTIGGGRILAVDTKRSKRFEAGVIERLKVVASGDAELIVKQRLTEAGAGGLSVAALAEASGASRETLDDLVSRLGAVRVNDDIVVTAAAYEQVLTEVVAALEGFHREQPLKQGLDVETLKNALPSRPSLGVVQRAVRELVDCGRLQSAHEHVRIGGYDPFARLGEHEHQLVAGIERAFLARGLEPPSPEAVIGSSRAAKVIYGLLLETGRLVRLRTYDRDSEIVLHARTLEAAKQAVVRRFPYPEPFAVKDVRDLLGSTRRHVVPLLEHFDATGVTVRSGDLRRLRGG